MIILSAGQVLLLSEMLESLYYWLDKSESTNINHAIDSESYSVNRVIETKNKDYAVGDLLLGNFGWVSRTVCKAEDLSASRKLDPTLPVSPSTALGILGMPGSVHY